MVPVNPTTGLGAITGTNLLCPYAPAGQSSRIKTWYKKYVGRSETIALNEYGVFEVLEGAATNNRFAAKLPASKLALATVDIPPYPSTSFASEEVKQVRRYTMEDIATLERRIENVEEYVALSLLEKQSLDMEILGADGLPRFKNGIFVDNLTTDQLVGDPSLINIENGIARPPMEFLNVPLVKSGSGINVQNSGSALTLGINSFYSLVSQMDASKYIEVLPSNAILLFEFNPSVVMREADADGFATGEALDYASFIRFGAKAGRSYQIRFAQGPTNIGSQWHLASGNTLDLSDSIQLIDFVVNQPISVTLVEREGSSNAVTVAASSLFVTNGAAGAQEIIPIVDDLDPEDLWPGCPYLTAENRATGIYRDPATGNLFDAYGLCSLWFEPFMEHAEADLPRGTNYPFPYGVVHNYLPDNNYSIQQTAATNNVPVREYHFPVSPKAGNSVTQGLLETGESAMPAHIGILLKKPTVRRYLGDGASVPRTSPDLLLAVEYFFVDHEAGTTLPGASAPTPCSLSVVSPASFTDKAGFEYGELNCGWWNHGGWGVTRQRVDDLAIDYWKSIWSGGSYQAYNAASSGVELKKGVAFSANTTTGINIAMSGYNFALPRFGSTSLASTPNVPSFTTTFANLDDNYEIIWTNQPSHTGIYQTAHPFWATPPSGLSGMARFGNMSTRYGAFGIIGEFAAPVRYVHNAHGAKKLSVYAKYTVRNEAGDTLVVQYPPALTDGTAVKNVVIHPATSGNNTGSGYGSVTGAFGSGLPWDGSALIPMTSYTRGRYEIRRLNDGDNVVAVFDGNYGCSSSACVVDGDIGTELLDMADGGELLVLEVKLTQGSGMVLATSLLDVTVNLSHPALFTKAIDSIDNHTKRITIRRIGNCPVGTPTSWGVLGAGSSATLTLGMKDVVDVSFNYDNAAQIRLCR